MALGPAQDATLNLDIVFVGGVIPVQDYDFLRQAGVAGIFGPGTPISVCARQVLAAIKGAGVPA